MYPLRSRLARNSLPRVKQRVSTPRDHLQLQGVRLSRLSITMLLLVTQFVPIIIGCIWWKYVTNKKLKRETIGLRTIEKRPAIIVCYCVCAWKRSECGLLGLRRVLHRQQLQDLRRDQLEIGLLKWPERAKWLSRDVSRKRERDKNLSFLCQVIFALT
jgi:hypothetical protein